ncbi:putative 3-demethylubiquinone-9 3-methyltransferase (glyoxalase superfamily) [Pseudarthrobacter sp. W1I19]|uniref:VOC family protein n=1 Tax=Pseudarthrobacter sp. W1I19 TaxID=3042288 RepID=UPI00277FA6E2|nr:VOC family protein [Pseudarthrobacter sp. W1I19]MDQ0923517.1 putative 3-demethylubiquinone-9 3-methyltransferase (glyoxalase superfamily) [Pseudarthrobacter sp. W1I19]
MPRTIGTCLWFENEAEQAAEFYTSVFDNSKILNVSRLEGAPGPEGQAVAVEFELEGRTFTALNGARGAVFTEAVSFMVDCEDQETVDRYWSALTDGGSESQCGWLKDRFGVSWQVIPSVLTSLIAGTDPLGSRRAMQAMLGMRKLDIAELKKAYDG